MEALLVLRRPWHRFEIPQWDGNLEGYRLATLEPNCPRNFLPLADSNNTASLHLVILFISMVWTTEQKSNNQELKAQFGWFFDFVVFKIWLFLRTLWPLLKYFRSSLDLIFTCTVLWVLVKIISCLRNSFGFIENRKSTLNLCLVCLSLME